MKLLNKNSLPGGRVAVLFLIVLLSVSSAAQGVIDAFEFDNVEQEARYQSLVAIFRCPKCLNTNLAGSDGPIASDLRREIHRMVKEEQSDAYINDFMQSRYGDFVLYDPPFRVDTWILWLGPLVFLILGLAFLRRFMGQRESRMTDEERKELNKLLARGERSPSGE